MDNRFLPEYPKNDGAFDVNFKTFNFCCYWKLTPELIPKADLFRSLLWIVYLLEMTNTQFFAILLTVKTFDG